MRKIIHIDMDAFFAAVEQRDRPELKGKPVIVGGSPNSRGVVATASYEARVFGVHSAMSCSQAARLCPQGIFVKPRFEAYNEASQIIRSIFFDYSDAVEPLSLDEAYLDVTENNINHPSAIYIAREIKKRIASETRLTASAGVSYNKFLAKVASDINKPDGLTLIHPNDALKFLEELPIGKFYGVGKATRKKMEALGIKNGKDLKSWTEQDLIKAFGKTGAFYHKLVNGKDDRPVKSHRIRKSYGKERTFAEDRKSREWIEGFVRELAESISEGMEKKELAGKTVTLKVRYQNFDTITRSSTSAAFLRSPEDIARVAIDLLNQTEAGTRPVRLLGLSLSNLNVNETGIFEQLEIEF